MAHQIYKNKEGKRLPSVTTVLGVMDKPALKFWANNIGLQGIKMTEYVDDKAIIGTLAHYMIECYLSNKIPDYTEFKCDKQQIEQASKCFDKYLEWENYQDEFVPIANEIPLVSEKYQFAGCPDGVCILNGKLTLVDYKTCNGVYDEAKMQVIAYMQMINENFKELQEQFEILKNYKRIEQIVILRIGRNEDEGFEYIEVKKNIWEIGFNIFKNCLSIYQNKKEFTKLIKESNK